VHLQFLQIERESVKFAEKQQQLQDIRSNQYLYADLNVQNMQLHRFFMWQVVLL